MENVNVIWEQLSSTAAGLEPEGAEPAPAN